MKVTGAPPDQTAQDDWTTAADPCAASSKVILFLFVAKELHVLPSDGDCENRKMHETSSRPRARGATNTTTSVSTAAPYKADLGLTCVPQTQGMRNLSTFTYTIWVKNAGHHLPSLLVLFFVVTSRSPRWRTLSLRGEQAATFPHEKTAESCK